MENSQRQEHSGNKSETRYQILESSDGNGPVQRRFLPLTKVSYYEKKKKFWPLSGRPYFNVILNQTHLKPTYYLEIPTIVLRQWLSHIDNKTPLVIKYSRKKWEGKYILAGTPKRAYIGWKSFVNDNNLHVGDAVVMEFLTACTTLVKTRVQILRGEFPAELQNKQAPSQNGEAMSLESGGACDETAEYLGKSFSQHQMG